MWHEVHAAVLAGEAGRPACGAACDRVAAGAPPRPGGAWHPVHACSPFAEAIAGCEGFVLSWQRTHACPADTFGRWGSWQLEHSACAATRGVPMTVTFEWQLVAHDDFASAGACGV